ncbi:MAG: AEC family transporter [Pseudomonadota bacterium]
MLQALTDAILPIFAVMAIGFALGARGLVAPEAPGHINRFVLLVAVPSLLFGILSAAPLSAFDWQAIGVYAAGEVVVYALGFLIARYVFVRAADEALLLGFAAAFVNHVLFVLPVAEGLYGTAAAAPIAAIVTVDALVTWPLTVVAMEAITGKGRPPAVIVGQVLKNPMLLGPALGLAVNFAGLSVHPGLERFLGFAGAAAAPAALFALGVTLSSSDLRRFGGVSLSIAALAIFAHPAVVWALNALYGAPSQAAALMVLLAAGPCGAMPYALATFYGTPPQSIAKAIVLSTVASLFSLALLA